MRATNHSSVQMQQALKDKRQRDLLVMIQEGVTSRPTVFESNKNIEFHSIVIDLRVSRVGEGYGHQYSHFFFFSSRRRHTRSDRDWSSDVCSSDLKIAAPHGLGIIEEFKLARSLTDRPIKATVPGPYTLLVPLKLGGGYRDRDTLLADLVAIVNAECKALVAVGADFIQIDEPHHGMYAGAMPDVARGINRAMEGVTAKLAVHVCFGNLYGRPFNAVRD